MHHDHDVGFEVQLDQSQEEYTVIYKCSKNKHLSVMLRRLS